MKRTIWTLAVLFTLMLPFAARADCGNEPPAGLPSVDVVTPVLTWIHKALWDGVVELPGGWAILFRGGIRMTRPGAIAPPASGR